jgi:hypothetical protein
MYRIQAYNFVNGFFSVEYVKSMEAREAHIRRLIESQEYTRAGITWEWIARS